MSKKTVGIPAKSTRRKHPIISTNIVQSGTVRVCNPLASQRAIKSVFGSPAFTLVPADQNFQCVMEPPKPITLRSKKITMTGKFVYAYVPTRRGLERMRVFLKDNEEPVRDFIIENFSGKSPKRKKTA